VNKSIHFRFASYVLAVTAMMLGIVIFWHFSNALIPLFMFLVPQARESLLGPSFKGWHERDRDVSNRTLVIGFFVCLILIWVGGITVAHYFSPERHAPKCLLWIIPAAGWLLLIYPAYQWWRVQKIEPQSAA
jgi:hypothetical protein